MTARYFIAILLILVGFAGAAMGTGMDPTGMVELAKSADLLSDRGLFLCSQIVLLAGFCLGGRELLKRLDAANAETKAITAKHIGFVEERVAELTGALDQSNAVGLKTNDLLSRLDSTLKKP